MIKKVKGGYVVLHHKTPGKIGTRIDATKKPVSKKKALAIHAAIFANQNKKKKK